MRLQLAIFTPTFNRSKELKRLYESLLNQENQNFTWYVVDDGSIDDTRDLIGKFSKQSPFKIIYYQQENQGKHAAINTALSLIEEPWYLLVDSDDFLLSDCAQHLILWIESRGGDYDAYSFCRSRPNGEIIGDLNDVDLVSYTQRLNRKISGDKAGIHRTKRARMFEFPQFQGETFMSELPFFIWWSESKFKTDFSDYSGYVCEYLDDGLSSNITKLRYKNPNGTRYVYSYISNTKELKYVLRLKARINYWRFFTPSLRLTIKELRPIDFVCIPIGGAMSILYYITTYIRNGSR